jgi:outer membrane protein OmpA-like peptidoglycan-associated protein
VKEEISATSYVMVNGIEQRATVVPNETSSGLDVKTGDWNLSISANEATGVPAPLNAQNQIIIKEEQSAFVAGEGFKPDSEVNVYIFSTPILLGTTKTTSTGSFRASFPIPANLEEGNHLLQVNGISSRNDLRSATLPVVYEKVKVAAKESTPIADPTPAPTPTPSSTPTPALAATKKPVTLKKRQVVIPFNFNDYSLSKKVEKILRTLELKPGVRLSIRGYAQPTRPQSDLAISLNRAIEVKKVIAKIAPKVSFEYRGEGSKKSPLCSSFRNKCVVVTIV